MISITSTWEDETWFIGVSLPMKLHILNDLHAEFEDFEPPVTDVDVLAQAGDIGSGLPRLVGIARRHKTTWSLDC